MAESGSNSGNKRRQQQQLRYCTKCLDRHVAPTGRNCKRNRDDDYETNHEHRQADPTDTSIQAAIQRTLANISARIGKLETKQTKTKKKVTIDLDEEEDEYISDAEYDSENYDAEEGSDEVNDSDSESGDLAQREKRKKRAKKLGQNRKSGVLRVGGRDPRNVFKWPQEHITRRGGGTPRWDELTPAELVLGFSKMANRSTERGRDAEAVHIRSFQEVILKDLDRFKLTTVRRAVEAVLVEIENEDLRWSSKREIQFVRQQELAMPEHTTTAKAENNTNSGTSTKAKDNKSGKGSRYCLPFQKGECPIISSSHGSDHGRVRHICAYCFRNERKHYSHSELACDRKPGNQEGGQED